MKKMLLILLLIVIIGVLASAMYFFVQHMSKHQSPLPSQMPSVAKTISPTSIQASFCKPSDLRATVMFQGADGNIYGSLLVKNTSAADCQIQGNKLIQAMYQASNIAIKHIGTPGAAILTLQPNQTLYSQIHYPNGPQCNGPTKQATISFSYPIGPNATVVFKDEQTGRTIHTLPVCQSASEVTTIQIWSLSDKPINQ